MTRIAFLVVLASLVVGCPPAEKEKKKAPDSNPVACARVGQTCEVSPGKLGTCVSKDGCTDPGTACFVCQSQH